MKINKTELVAILSQFNPRWRGEGIPDLAGWRRAAFHELYEWMISPPAPRAVLLTGPRQVGKTTLLLQSIEELLAQGVPSANILYATYIVTKSLNDFGPISMPNNNTMVMRVPAILLCYWMGLLR